MSEHVSRQEAVRIVNEADSAIIIAADVEPMPVLGELESPGDRKLRLTVNRYRCGEEFADIDVDEYNFETDDE